MITPTQMRAARAMLDVSQGHVAEYLGIAANTLSKIESGQSDVSVSRNADIQRFYEREGIAFTENDGVKWDKDQILVLKGAKGFCDFYDQIYDVALKEGGDICLYNAVSDLVNRWLGDYLQVHIKRMQAIKDKFRFRVILEEGDTAYLGRTYCEYKWYPKDLFNNYHFYVFGSKVGFVTFDDDDVTIVVINNKGSAQTQKHLFDVAWSRIAFEPDE